MIEEMMDIKLREHDRKFHTDAGGDAEKFGAEMNRSMADQNSLRAIQSNLAGAIEEMFKGMISIKKD